MIHTYDPQSHSEGSIRLMHPTAAVLRPCPTREKNGVRRPTWFVFDEIRETVGHWTTGGPRHG